MTTDDPNSFASRVQYLSELSIDSVPEAPPKLRDDPPEIGSDRWPDDFDWAVEHPHEEFRWATGTGSDVRLLPKPLAKGERCVRFWKRNADPDLHTKHHTRAARTRRSSPTRFV